MRVALLSYNALAQDAIGNHVAETAGFFLERGSALRVFVQSVERLHPALRGCTQPVDNVAPKGPVWDYLAGADLVIAQYAQAYDLLHFLPLLAGGKPRLLLDYHSVTPPALWTGPNREALEQGVRELGLVWCADEAIAHSESTRQELATATTFPPERIHRLPLVVDRQRFLPGDGHFLQRRLGLPNASLMLFVGRLAGNKRVPLLVEALANLPPNVHAVVIGDVGDLYGAEAKLCQARAEELNVAERLHLLGQVTDDELTEAYRSADVLVMPSLHEGFCIPVVEAMASGLPVVAARSAALPETVGDAGLTFTPNDAADLARQVRRVLARSAAAREPSSQRKLHVAVVCFRFGTEVVGGAETSLRTIAKALQGAGHRVEVYTTCTLSESNWRNELPAGTTTCDGLTVHRFAIDAHDRAAYLESVRAIVEPRGPVTPEQEAAYLRHSLHSTALLQALEKQAGELDAIIAGPYLVGLTCDVAQAFPERTLLLPCFHDETIARLTVWPKVYGAVGGMLLHSPEEKELTLTRLGINGPDAVEIGTWLPTKLVKPQTPAARPYVVYCGRYSQQKNVPLLLDWMRRYQEERPGRFDLVLLGHGEVPMPREPWVRNLGRVDEERKHAVLAAARALVQLSQQESLSLVALEAWAQETPVIVHRGCAVLAGQVQRSQGGVAVGEYAEFSDALDEIFHDPPMGRERGLCGRAYVESRYASEEQFLARLEGAIADLDVPLCERLRRRGLERAAMCDRGAWREAMGRIVENLLDAAPRAVEAAIDVQPLRDQAHVRAGVGSTLVPVRVHNLGTLAAIADGPAKTVLVAEVRVANGGNAIGAKVMTDLPALLVPGATQTAMLLVPAPPQIGSFDLHVGTEYPDGGGRRFSETARVLLHVGPNDAPSGLAPLLDGIRPLLLQARQAQRLPEDYLDVTEGWLARWKRWTKKTLLNNFKLAYVDVMSRQQSHVNQQLVAAVEQLAECCATLDHAVRIQQSRLAELERCGETPPANGRVCVQEGANGPRSAVSGGSDA